METTGEGVTIYKRCPSCGRLAEQPRTAGCEDPRFCGVQLAEAKRLEVAEELALRESLLAKVKAARARGDKAHANYLSPDLFKCAERLRLAEIEYARLADLVAAANDCVDCAVLRVKLGQALAALGVLTKDARIRAWLEENDPKALEQAVRAAAA